MNILCVDDDDAIRQLLIETLKKMPLPQAVLADAASGREALDIIAARSVDLVLLDLVLPDLPGLEVLGRIKEVRPCTEVLVLTGHASVESAVAAMKAGARDYIEKPVELALLREKVGNIVELLEREREAEEFRFAKECMEAGARRNLTSLEEAISVMRQCQAQVMGILESEQSDSEKVKRVRATIDHFHRKCG